MWRSHYESGSFFWAFPMALQDRLVRLPHRFPVIFDAYPIHSPFIFHIPDILPLYPMIFPLMLLKSPLVPMSFLWFSYGCPMVFSYGFPMIFLWFSYGFPMVSRINYDPWISPTAPSLPRSTLKVSRSLPWFNSSGVITVITGDFYGIISTNKLVKLGYKYGTILLGMTHSINGVTSTYNWYFGR